MCITAVTWTFWRRRAGSFPCGGRSAGGVAGARGGFPAIEAHLHYEAPARYDDELIIEVVLTELDRLNLVFAYGVSNARKQIILTARTRHVCAGLDEKPKRMPSEVFFKLNPSHPAAPPSETASATPRAPKTPAFPI